MSTPEIDQGEIVFYRNGLNNRKELMNLWKAPTSTADWEYRRGKSSRFGF